MRWHRAGERSRFVTGVAALLGLSFKEPRRCHHHHDLGFYTDHKTSCALRSLDKDFSSPTHQDRTQDTVCLLSHFGEKKKKIP